MKYVKKPIPVEASQWFRAGDHPAVTKHVADKDATCKRCGALLAIHGWVDTLEGGHIVCVGDWIITGVRGEHYPIKKSIFRETYEPAPAQEKLSFLG